MNSKEFDKYFVKTSGIWSGAQPANFILQFPFQGPNVIILNTDESDGRGLHWVALYVPYSGPLEFFDSLGESPESYHDYFRDWLVASGRSYMRNEYRYQDYGTDTCGEFCVYYGVKRLRGEPMPEIVHSLNARNLHLNEFLVSDFICRLI